MGTRADFYVGRGEKAEWLGSIAWDGHHDTIAETGLFERSTEQAFREGVAELLAGRDDATLPAHGWPWPWENSQTTDYAYAFDGDRAWGSCFGGRWFDATQPKPEQSDDEGEKEAVFPQMKRGSSAPAGSKRSGLLVFSIPKGE